MLPLPSNSRIFLTGGTGFLGRTLLDFVLANQNETVEVDVLCRDPDRFQHDFPQYRQQPQLHFLKGNILDRLVPERLYSHVIHAAADTHSAGGSSIEWARQIVFGTENMLDFAIRAQAKRFLFLSSGAIYGPQPSDLSQLTEGYLGAPSTTEPGSVYGQAKRLAEQICTAQNQLGKIETVIARCFAFGGKHIPLNGPYAFGNFIRDALYSNKICVKGDGSAIRSYLAGEDMANWLFTMLVKGQAGHAYNVGSDQPVSMEALATKMRELLAPDKPVVIEKCSTFSNTRSVYIPCIAKAALLGLQPTIGLDAIITDVANYLKKASKQDA